MDAFREMMRGWLGKLLLILITVPFLIVGLESYFSGGGRVAAITVNGAEVLQSEVDQAVDAQRQRVLEQMGPQAKASQVDMARIRTEVINGMISRELLTQQSKENGYLVSDAMVHKLIRDIPAFQENGVFSNARYQEVLRQNNENPAAYPAKAKQEMAYSMLIAGLGQSGFVATTEINRLSVLDSQTRDVHVAIIPAAQYLEGLAATDDEVSAFYKKHSARFTTKEKISLDYVVVQRSDFLAKATVTDEDLQARYADKLKSSSANEQRSAQHILINVDGKTDAATALKKIQEVAKRARSGEDFGSLAKAFSQDVGSVSVGGDLGFTGRGQLAPEFETALFALKEGEVSAPVKTQFGYHLIKLNKVKKEEAPSFASLKSVLEQEAKVAKAEQLFVDQVEKIDVAAYESADLAEVSEKFNAPVASTDLFDRRGGAGIAAERKIIDTAFSDDILKENKNSVGLQLADGRMVWVHVKKHMPAELRPLVDVKEAARNDVLLEKAEAKAKMVASAVIAAVKKGESLADVAARENISWQSFPATTRRTQTQLPEISRMAYTLPRPATGKVSAGSFSAALASFVVAVSKVTDGTPVAASEIAQMRNVLSENRSQQEFQDYIQALREAGKVVVAEQSKK